MPQVYGLPRLFFAHGLLGSLVLLVLQWEANLGVNIRRLDIMK